MAYVSIFTNNDLTHITEDHFEIELIARSNACRITTYVPAMV